MNLSLTIPGNPVGKQRARATWHPSAETRKKLSLAALGKRKSQEAIKKSAEARRGAKRSIEARARMSAAKKGKRLTEQHKQHIREASGGWHHLEEAKKKIADAMRTRLVSLTTKQKNSEYQKTRIGPLNPMFGKRHSISTKKKISNTRIGKYGGERSPRWRGGISAERYSPGFTEFTKRQIRERDNYICQLCGASGAKRNLDIHHVDYCKNNHDPDNLISLCKPCHTKTSSNRNAWTNFLYDLRRSS